LRRPAVIVLEHVDIVGVEQAGNDDLARLHRDEALPQRRLAQDGLVHRRDPGSCNVGQRPRRDHLAMAAINHRKAPDVGAVGTNAAGTGLDHGAAGRGIDGVGDHEPGDIHQGIRIFEGDAEWPLQRVADRMVRNVDSLGWRQRGHSAEAVVDEEPGPDQ
jgi:hypothetical protein